MLTCPLSGSAEVMAVGDFGGASMALQSKTLMKSEYKSDHIKHIYLSGHSASTSDSSLGNTRPKRQISLHSDTGFPVKCSFLTPSWALVFLYDEHVESPRNSKKAHHTFCPVQETHKCRGIYFAWPPSVWCPYRMCMMRYHHHRRHCRFRRCCYCPHQCP